MQEERIGAVPYQASVASHQIEPAGSGVSWAAILAGAAAAAAISFILIILGVGFGLSAVSPWHLDGATAATIGISAIVWLSVTQIIASGLGGYLAGRLRVKWADVDVDEVYFRDTAHGLLTWAIATLVTVIFLGSALTGVLGTGAKLTGEVASGAMGLASTAVTANSASQNQSGDSVLSYFTDTLFRSDKPAENESAAQTRNEVVGIFVNSMRNGLLSSDDKAYLAQRVAQNTGLSQADAEQRVDQVYGALDKTVTQAKVKAQEAADAARKAAATTSIWAFVALLLGAFFASLFAVFGGRRRDVSFVVHSNQ